MSSWSELPLDLLVEIVACIEKLEDFMAFGAVCKGWFAVGKKKEYFKGLWLRQGTPYLLLPIKDDKVDSREFYSLVEGETVASLRIPKCNERKCHESLGWLLAVESNGTMCLLDPFTSVEIPLPHQSTFPGYEFLRIDEYVFVWKFVLSARPNETSDYIVMIIAGGLSKLAFWRPGDKSWNINGIQSKCYRDVMYYGGHFYAITVHGHAWIYTFKGVKPPRGQMVTHLVVDKITNIHAGIDDFTREETLYILKTLESLLIIARTAGWYSIHDRRSYSKTAKFRVYEVDMARKTWVEIDSLGSMAIFVGHNTTFAIDTCRRSFGKIKGNHIYFTDDGWYAYHFEEEKGGGKDMGAYNMETGTIESFYSGQVLLSKVCLPIWVTPSSKAKKKNGLINKSPGHFLGVKL